MNDFNLHTHSCFCDGKEAPEKYVKQAIDIGFHTLGFSGHAPLPFENTFSIKNNDILNYCNTILKLKKKYKEKINIFLSLEMDYIPGISWDFSVLKNNYNLDYSIGSVHLVKNDNNEKLWFIDGAKAEIYDNGLDEIFNGNIKEGVSHYYNQINNMILFQKPDILGHFDKIKMHNKNRYFSEQELWYKKLVKQSLKLVSEKNVIVEVNTRGIYKERCNSLFPGEDILHQMYMLDIPITLSSDAHHPLELNKYFEEAKYILKNTGFKNLMYFSDQGWKKQKI